MAEEHGDTHATADLSEHLRTWRSFLSVIKWNILGAVILLLALLIFRTNA